MGNDAAWYWYHTDIVWLLWCIQMSNLKQLTVHYSNFIDRFDYVHRKILFSSSAAEIQISASPEQMFVTERQVEETIENSLLNYSCGYTILALWYDDLWHTDSKRFWLCLAIDISWQNRIQMNHVADTRVIKVIMSFDTKQEKAGF